MATEANKERQPPLLLTIHGDQREKHSFYSMLHNRFQHTSIPILSIKEVLASAFGWLVLVDPYADECVLWNPTTWDIIELPEMENSCTFITCVLTKPPTEPDCHILFNSATTFKQSFCKIGDNEFVAQSLEENDDVYSLSAIASFQGKIYGLVKPGNRFVTINFVGKTLELKPILHEGRQPWRIHIPSPPWSNSDCDCDYLIESWDGELLLVRKMFASYSYEDFCDFKVFRVDTNRMVCTELENIGNRAIFLSYWGSGYCCSAEGIRPNSIYYTDEKSVNLFVYNLDDRSTTLLQRCPGRLFKRATFWVDQQTLHNLINFSK